MVFTVSIPIAALLLTGAARLSCGSGVHPPPLNPAELERAKAATEVFFGQSMAIVRVEDRRDSTLYPYRVHLRGKPESGLERLLSAVAEKHSLGCEEAVELTACTFDGPAGKLQRVFLANSDTYWWVKNVIPIGPRKACTSRPWNQ